MMRGIKITSNIYSRYIHNQYVPYMVLVCYYYSFGNDIKFTESSNDRSEEIVAELFGYAVRLNWHRQIR